MFSKPLKELMSNEAEVDDAALISIDSRGVDVRVRQGAQVCLLLQYITIVLVLIVLLSCLLNLSCGACSLMFRGFHL